MFDLFRQEVQKSDKIKLYLTTGKEIDVIVVEIAESSILVENSDGSQSRLFGTVIGGWDLIKKHENPSQLLYNNDISVEHNGCNKEQDESIEKNPELGRLALEQPEVEEPTHQKKIGLTIVGKINLDKIEPKKKRIKRLPASNIQVRERDEPRNMTEHIRDHQLKFSSLKDLQRLKQKIINESGKQLVPANGIVKRYGNQKFGFITDTEGKDYTFYLNDVLDSALIAILEKPVFSPIHVLCSFKSISNKNRATNVCLPKTAEELYKDALNYYYQKDDGSALTILNMALNSVKDYQPCLTLKRQIIDNQNRRKLTHPLSSSIYAQAKLAFKRENVEEGKKLLFQLIQSPNARSESALKQLSYELQREGKIDEAIQLVAEHKKLIKSSDPNSLLAYFYETKRDFKTAVAYLDRLKPATALEKIKLDKRLAVCFFHLKDYFH